VKTRPALGTAAGRFLYMLKILSFILALLLLSIPGFSAEPRVNTILYGAAYYHEYMPYERLEKDIELMKQAGISLVRVGESTWTSWEPRDGEFQFDWMQRILDGMHKAGIQVVLGTPTYSIPPWLYRKHPEIVVTQLTKAPPLSNPTEATYPGSTFPGAYGPRQNMDISHPTYRYYSERVIRQIMARFKDHPAIIGYQVDNETHSPGVPTLSTHAAFVEYLKRKFGTTQKLNELWGLAYWGQLVDNWDEFPARTGILNPGYKLEWERFQQQIVTDFLAWQAKIVREYARPGQFVMHDFVGGLRPGLNQFEIARHMDYSGVNPYHSVQDDLDGYGPMFSGDVNRSLKHKPYFVTETNAQGIGWDSRTQYPPYDNQLRLNVFTHVACGANMVAYWHWHSLHYGQETYWKGVLSHDLEPNRVFGEVSRIGAELRKIGPRLANLTYKNDVGILFSADSHHGIEFMPFADRTNYMSILNQFYRALYNANVGVDFIFPERTNFSDYKVVIVPPLYVASDELLARLTAYVKGGGHVLMSLKSGFTNEYNTVRWTRAPGPLREAAGFYYQEFSNLKAPMPLKDDPFAAGEGNRVSTWAEMIIPETATLLATYDHSFFGKYPAITRNRLGGGTLTYQGTVLSNDLQGKVVMDVLKLGGLGAGADQKLPARVKVRHARNSTGKAVHFYLNFSAEPQTISYAYGRGTDLPSGRAVASASSQTLEPWGVLIVEEQ
jgi:beta-galactosidase